MSDNLDKAISFISSKKENIELIKNNIHLHSNKDPIDIIYEMAFITKEENQPLKKAIDMMKNNKIFHNHPNFESVSKQMIEMDHFMDKPFEVSEGVNVCSKCKSKRTLSHNRQTRSGDEGMTVYVFCIDCKFRCTMNS